jgi:hypothetical protein
LGSPDDVWGFVSSWRISRWIGAFGRRPRFMLNFLAPRGRRIHVAVLGLAMPQRGGDAPDAENRLLPTTRVAHRLISTGGANALKMLR